MRIFDLIAGLQERVIDKAAERVGRRLLVEKASRAAIADYQQDYTYREGYKEETEEEYIRAHELHVWVYACVNAIAQSLAGLPLRIWEGKGDDRKEITDGPAMDLLMEPSPGQTGYDLIEATGVCTELTGDGYWEIARSGDGGKPRQLHWLFPERMKAYPDPEGEKLVTEYGYSIGGRRISFKPEDIIHFRYFNPRSKSYGRSPMKAISGSTLTLDFYRIAYSKNFFKQGARLSAYLSVKDELSDSAFKRLSEDVKRLYGGVAKAHEVGVFEGDAEIKEWGSKPKDVEFLALAKLSREEILAALGVEPAVVGLFEYANYANSKEQFRIFYQNTIIPKKRKFESQINILLREFGDKLWCEFDTSGVEALNESENSKIKRDLMKANAANILVKGSILTVNEIRKEWYGDKQPVDWGDEPPTPASPLGLSKGIKKKDNKAWWREWAEEARRHENKLFAILKDQFGRMEKEVLKNLRQKIGKQDLPIDLILFDLDTEGKLLISSVEILLQDAAQFFGDEALVRIRMGRSFDLYDPKALKVLRKHIEEYFGAKGVAKTLREKLTIQLQEGYRLGESMEQMRERTQEVFAGYVRGSAMRSRMIARSETIRAANGATQSAWEQSKVVKRKRWLPATDACKVCLAIGGDEPVALDKNFDGREFGDLAYPPAHPNCVLPNTKIIAPQVEAALRMFYRGQVIELLLANRTRLAVTPNHKILTPNGLISTNQLRLGDDVVYSPYFERIISGQPDNDRQPIVIEKIFHALMESPEMTPVRVPVAPEYLHGDALFGQGDIHIIAPDGFLQYTSKSSCLKHSSHNSFDASDANASLFSGDSPFTYILLTTGHATHSGMGGAGKALAFLGRGASHASIYRLTPISAFKTIFQEPPAYDTPADPQILRQCLLRFASLISTDKIIGIKIYPYRGHVYDLQTFSTLYISNGILSSNCRCAMTAEM